MTKLTEPESTDAVHERNRLPQPRRDHIDPVLVVGRTQG